MSLRLLRSFSSRWGRGFRLGSNRCVSLRLRRNSSPAGSSSCILSPHGVRCALPVHRDSLMPGQRDRQPHPDVKVTIWHELMPCVFQPLQRQHFGESPVVEAGGELVPRAYMRALVKRRIEGNGGTSNWDNEVPPATPAGGGSCLSASWTSWTIRSAVCQITTLTVNTTESPGWQQRVKQEPLGGLQLDRSCRFHMLMITC